MASLAKNIGELTVGMQSLALAGRAAQMVPKDFSSAKPRKQSKKMIGGFTDIMVGTAMIKPTADIVSTL